MAAPRFKYVVRNHALLHKRGWNRNDGFTWYGKHYKMHIHNDYLEERGAFVVGGDYFSGLHHFIRYNPAAADEIICSVFLATTAGGGPLS